MREDEEIDLKGILRTIEGGMEAGDEELVLGLLERVKQAKVTLPMLQSTKAGITLGRLRKQGEGEVRKRIGEIIQGWKRVAKGSVEKEEYTPLRSKIQEMFCKAFSKHEGAAKYTAKEVSVEVEKALYNINIDTDDYKKNFRPLYAAVNSQNPILREQILQGEVEAEQFCRMDSKQLASKERQAEKEKIAHDLTLLSTVPQPTAMTKMFRCGKCGKRECSFYQLQTRSADEPMTTFVTCCNCGNRWRG